MVGEAPYRTPISSPSPYVEDEKEVQDEVISDDHISEYGGVEQGEQPPPHETVEEPQVRSTRQHQPSRRYSTSEYILLIDEEQESLQETHVHKEKENRLVWTREVKCRCSLMGLEGRLLGIATRSIPMWSSPSTPVTLSRNNKREGKSGTGRTPKGGSLVWH